MSETIEWAKVGEVGVDSACVWIGDPCYLIDGTSEIMDAIDFEQSAQQYNYAAGHAGLGVLVSPGLGDGSYDVFVRYVDAPGWGRRVAEAKIVFITEADLVGDDMPSGEAP